MNRLKTHVLFVIILQFLLLPIVFAAPVKSEVVVGKFGFNWLKPEKAQCVVITAEAAAKFKTCDNRVVGETGSFTGQADLYKCQAGPKSEYMIYKTKARCVEELEAMKENED